MLHHPAISSALVHEQRVRNRTEDAGRMARMETGRLLQGEGIFRAGEKAWGGKGLATKPDDLSLIPSSFMMKGEN